jgi:hypothetical protein
MGPMNEHTDMNRPRRATDRELAALADRLVTLAERPATRPALRRGLVDTLRTADADTAVHVFGILATVDRMAALEH